MQILPLCFPSLDNYRIYKNSIGVSTELKAVDTFAVLKIGFLFHEPLNAILTCNVSERGLKIYLKYLGYVMETCKQPCSIYSLHHSHKKAVSTRTGPFLGYENFLDFWCPKRTFRGWSSKYSVV